MDRIYQPLGVGSTGILYCPIGFVVLDLWWKRAEAARYFALAFARISSMVWGTGSIFRTTTPKGKPAYVYRLGNTGDHFMDDEKNLPQQPL